MGDNDGPDVSIQASLPASDGPLVSVVTPTYDDAEYIGDALVSLADQTYTNLEVIVVDSSAVDWLADLVESLEWGTYCYEPPNGVAAARNRGIDEARGEVIAFLDADDYYAPEKLERQVSEIDDGADVVYGNVEVLEENGTKTEVSALPVKDSDDHHVEFFKSGHGVPTVTLAARSECFDAERFDESLDAREDPHLWVRLFRRWHPVAIPEVLATKRRRSNSLTSDPEMMYENELAAVSDLTERFEELRPHRERRERMARYRYGKHLFHAGRHAEARRILAEVITDGMVDHRALTLLAVSFLPRGNERVVQLLERMQMAVRGLFRSDESKQ